MIASVLCRRAALAALLARRRDRPAFAGDRPATPGGAEAVQAFLDRFLPAPPPGSPPLGERQDGRPGLRRVGRLSAINGVLGERRVLRACDARLQALRAGRRQVADRAGFAAASIVAHGRDGTSVLEVEELPPDARHRPRARLVDERARRSADKGASRRGAAEARPGDRFRPAQGRLRDDCQRRRLGLELGQQEINDVTFKLSADRQGGSRRQRQRADGQGGVQRRRRRTEVAGSCSTSSASFPPTAATSRRTKRS